MRSSPFRNFIILASLTLFGATASLAGRLPPNCHRALLNQAAYFVTEESYDDPMGTGGKIYVMSLRKTKNSEEIEEEGEFNIAFERGSLNLMIQHNPELLAQFGFSIVAHKRHYPDLVALNGRVERMANTPWATEFRYWNNEGGLEVLPLEHIRLRSQNKLIYSPPSLELSKASFHYHELSLHWTEIFLPAPIQKASVETDAMLIAIHDSPVLSKNERVRKHIQQQIERRSKELDRLTADVGRSIVNALEGKPNQAKDELFGVTGEGWYQNLWKKELANPSKSRLSSEEIAELERILERYPVREISADDRARIYDDFLARLKKLP